MQGTVSSALIRMLHDFVAHRGLDALEVLGVPPPTDLTGMSHVSTREWFRLLDRTQAAFNEPALGLAIAAFATPHHGGVLAYLTQSGQTLAESLLHLRKYERLIHHLNLCQFSVDLKSVWLKWGQERGWPGQLSDECLIAGMINHIRRMTACPDLAPMEVHFIGPRPTDPGPYERYFGCPVRFGAPVVTVRLPLSWLVRRLVHADTTLRDLLEHQAADLLQKLPPDDVFRVELQAVIAGLLPKGMATVSHCAKRLNCSTRTLQRQLETRGTHFQAVLDETRMRLAEAHLSDPKIRLIDLAHTLGYVDQTAFTRAFTRWKGDSPARWRKAHADLKLI